MNKFQQLSIEEREKIQEGLWNRISVREIARRLGRSPSSIAREINNNLPWGYRRYSPRLAHNLAAVRRIERGRRPRLKNKFIKKYVLEKLKLRWSPEQISGKLGEEYGYKISHEAIYQFIYSQYYDSGSNQCIGLDLVKYLRRKHKRRHRKYVPLKEIPANIRDKVLIDQRPAVVDRRIQFGHWETDSMVSGKSLAALNTTVERVSGYVCISQIENTKSRETAKAVIARLSDFPEHLRKTITSDNGNEFALHQEISKALGADFYFCHPYSSHERGTNENTNGLIRDFFPKKTDFATISISKIQKAEYLLNTRPRKRLKWKTPLEVIGVAITRGI